jgi:hypothetical protein
VTTIPSRLARLTQSSGSWPVAQQRARSLYRQWYRAGQYYTLLCSRLYPANSSHRTTYSSRDVSLPIESRASSPRSSLILAVLARSASPCSSVTTYTSTQLYAINFPASAIRAKVRQEFERNSLVDDLETVDILLLKGHQEFQEVRGLIRWLPR